MTTAATHCEPLRLPLLHCRAGPICEAATAIYGCRSALAMQQSPLPALLLAAILLSSEVTKDPPTLHQPSPTFLLLTSIQVGGWRAGGAIGSDLQQLWQQGRLADNVLPNRVAVPAAEPCTGIVGLCTSLLSRCA